MKATLLFFASKNMDLAPKAIDHICVSSCVSSPHFLKHFFSSRKLLIRCVIHPFNGVLFVIFVIMIILEAFLLTKVPFL